MQLAATILLLGGGLFALGCSAPVTGPTPPTNLLLITLDTLRADHLGCYGYPRPTSPNLDAFAARATMFADVTCSMPSTLPSHVTIFTGLSPEVHGVTQNGMVPPRDLETVFDLLGREGRRTAAIVSAGVVQERFLKGLGFDQVVFDRAGPKVFQIRGEVVTQNATRWLERHADQPFALWLHYFDPHEPYDPRPGLARRFSEGYDGPLGDSLTMDWLASLNDPAVEATLTEADRQHVVDLYDAEIAELDRQLERIFDVLGELGLWDSTLVVVVADHGQAHGENGFWGHGVRLLEPVIKVAMMLRYPGQSQGRVVAEAVETLDLAPTIAQWFGLGPLPGLPGRSLVEAATGTPIEPALRRIVERCTFSEQPERQGLVVHRVASKGTYYAEPEGEEYRVGRLDGVGGLDGQNFFVEGSRDFLWFSDEVNRYRLLMRIMGGEISEGDVEMLRALGYTQ